MGVFSAVTSTQLSFTPLFAYALSIYTWRQVFQAIRVRVRVRVKFII